MCEVNDHHVSYNNIVMSASDYSPYPYHIKEMGTSLNPDSLDHADKTNLIKISNIVK